MQFTDGWMAGKLGSTELAAMTPAGLLVSLLSVFGIEALTGVTAQVSQSIGKGKPAMAAMATWKGIYCGALFGWLCLILYPAAYDAVNLLVRNQSHELLTLETTYFRISLIGLAPLMAATAVGNPRGLCRAAERGDRAL
jgi:Na+-driven multidrug efflux pump